MAYLNDVMRLAVIASQSGSSVQEKGIKTTKQSPPSVIEEVRYLIKTFKELVLSRDGTLKLSGLAQVRRESIIESRAAIRALIDENRSVGASSISKDNKQLLKLGT